MRREGGLREPLSLAVKQSGSVYRDPAASLPTASADQAAGLGSHGLRTDRFRPLLTLHKIAAESTQSAIAANCDLECVADLIHPLAAKSAETFDECGERHALDGIEIHD